MSYDGALLDKEMAHVPLSTEVQTLTITGTPTGGDFTLTYDDQTTAPIAFDAAASAVDSALEALSNIGAGEVTCSGGPLPDDPVVITFSGALASTNVLLLVADDAGLTGGTDPTATVALTTGGYGAECVALNAGIDTLGALIDTFAASFSAVEIQSFHEHLYKLGRMIADGLKDQTS